MFLTPPSSWSILNKTSLSLLLAKWLEPLECTHQTSAWRDELQPIPKPTYRTFCVCYFQCRFVNVWTLERLSVCKCANAHTHTHYSIMSTGHWSRTLFKTNTAGEVVCQSHKRLLVQLRFCAARFRCAHPKPVKPFALTMALERFHKGAHPCKKANEKINILMWTLCI